MPTKNSASIDLGDLLSSQGQLEISIRPTESKPDGQARRWKDQVTFTVSISMIGVVFLVCLAVLLFGHPSAEEQRWVQSALTLILGAVIGATFKK